jgi:hypothetical protein
MNETTLFVEETAPEGYKLLWTGESPQEAMTFLITCTSQNRLELWSRAHANSPKGFAPMAYRDNDGKVMVSQTFRMLCLN